MNRRTAAFVALVMLLSACTDNAAQTAFDSSIPSAPEPTVEVSTSTTAVSPTTAPTTTAPPRDDRPVATTLVPPPGPLFGIAVPEGDADTVVDIERGVDETFHLIRLFVRWEVDLAQTDIARLQAGGRAIHLSVRPVRADGTVIPWSEIASAPEGSMLHDEMIRWADDVIALGPDARFTFNHEPETRESTPNGDALEYRAAWRRMIELVRNRGGDDIEMVWTVGAAALREAEGRAFYPGDDVVDVIGADLYNWFTCQGTDRPWVSFDDLVEPAVEFAAERGKPLALPEFASAADPADPDRRAGWMDAAVDVMTGWDPAERMGVELDYVAWFDVTAPGGTNPDCRWSHRTDVETEQAFSRMVRDLIGR